MGDLDDEYIFKMEDVLKIYEQPLSEREPVVCVDEKPVVLHKDTRASIPMQPGQVARRDYEYERCGTANVFCGIEPKARIHFTKVTPTRASPEFADFILEIAVHYSAADTIHLVMDNLSTHIHMLPELLHGDEKKVWGDAGYQGQTEVIHAAAPQAQDMTSRRVKTKAGVDEEQKRKNHTKARVRAKVEWPFRVLKRVFGFTKVRYRGLKKNHEWLCAGFALANLYLKRKRLAKINLRLALQGA